MKNTSKICTSIEQSKKLIELGIDVNTADMYYQWYSETESHPLAYKVWLRMHFGF